MGVYSLLGCILHLGVVVFLGTKEARFDILKRG